MQVANKVAIEERNDLKLEVIEAIESKKALVLVLLNMIEIPIRINNMTNIYYLLKFI